MTPGSRLAAFLGVAVVGSGVALIGSTATWERVVEAAQKIDSAIGTIEVKGTVHSYTAGDLGSPILPVALLCLVCSLLAFLVGPRARGLLTALIGVGAVAIIATSFTVPAPPASVQGVHRAGPAHAVTDAGAVVALVGAAGALPLAARVRRVRMPESGPEEGDV